MQRDQKTPRPESLPYVRWGIATGLLGAAAIAAFFLAIDLAAGRPFATPSALGATLFLSEPFDLTRPVEGLFVLGYTAVHTGVFIGLAMPMAALLLGRPAPPPLRPVALFAALALAFFAGAAALGVGFRGHAGVSLWSELGAQRVALSNGLAALAMSGLVTFALRSRRTGGAGATPTLASRQRADAATPIDERQLQAPPSGRMGAPRA